MNSNPILPPATLGVLGGGQLGMYFALAAHRLGYRVMVLDPDAHCPAARVADAHLVAHYDDPLALNEMAARCDAVTCEFENVPAGSLRTLATRRRVAPAANAVAVAQDRIAEKRFLNRLGLATAPFLVIETKRDLALATRFPGILKCSRQGYDGKGQITVHDRHELMAAWRVLKQVPCVLESRLDLDQELSVVLARGADGTMALFPVAENSHREGILATSIVPARVPPELSSAAREMAGRIACALDYVGVLAVEFFVCGEKLLVNEIAPRPHNSGHYTLDACDVCQFEQQVRALTGLPLVEPRLHWSAVMVNLLGDAWRPTPPWEHLAALEGARLHLYGKAEARPGRKMGHITMLSPDLAHALQQARRCRALLDHGVTFSEAIPAAPHAPLDSTTSLS